MNLDQLLDTLREDTQFMNCVSNWEVLPAKEAQYDDLPSSLVDGRIIDVLKQRGIRRLYTHQVNSIQQVEAGHDVVIVTPTASGKTMCYKPSLKTRMHGPFICFRPKRFLQTRYQNSMS
jgi:DEAD/DEAH box helicase domain-containing protein